jgi:hypothetical protein
MVASNPSEVGSIVLITLDFKMIRPAEGHRGALLQQYADVVVVERSEGRLIARGTVWAPEPSPSMLPQPGPGFPDPDKTYVKDSQIWDYLVGLPDERPRLATGSRSRGACGGDRQRSWVVGAGGTILTTRDGGNSWQAQTSGSDTWLQAVTFTSDGQLGYVLGSYGTILSTRDGGNSWKAQTRGLGGYYLRSMTFASDGQRGWAVGDFGTIFRTQDGGRSWQAQT